MSRPLGQRLRPPQVSPRSGPAAVPSQGDECAPDLSFSDQLPNLLLQKCFFFLPEGCWGEQWAEDHGQDTLGSSSSQLQTRAIPPGLSLPLQTFGAL